jgi:general secretion pathway protein B
MSYILDALKKAEAERNSAAGTHLHAPQPAVVAPLADEPSLRTKAWIRFGLTAVAAVVLALVWLKFWRAAPPVAAPPIVATAPAPGQQAPGMADAIPPAPAPQSSSAPPVAPPSPAAPPQEAPAKPAKQKARPAKKAAEKKPAKAAAPSESKPNGTASPSSENRIASLRELPQHIQSEIPALTVSGYIYSANKADRTVLINRKLLHEGDQVMPDLTLERLTPTGMVLNYKGYRYRASY